MTTSELETTFGISDRIRFSESTSGTITAHITNAHATADIVLRGAHVTHFQPNNAEPILWVSRDALFTADKAIRGGIPVCWPWFASHPTDNSKPAHGFARTSLWSVTHSEDQPEYTELVLTLTNTPATEEIWPHVFTLQLRVRLSTQLSVALIITNTGDKDFECGGALHSYFRVSDVRNCEVQGLNGVIYLDKLDDDARKTQNGPISIQTEVDCTFIDTTDTCYIHDPGLGRRIEIAKSGSRNTVVWNPWVDKSAGMADFANDEYPHMLCVETANADGDQITIAAGEVHTLETRIQTSSIS